MHLSGLAVDMALHLVELITWYWGFDTVSVWTCIYETGNTYDVITQEYWIELAVHKLLFQ